MEPKVDDIQRRLRRIAAMRGKTPEEVLIEALEKYESEPPDGSVVLTLEDVKKLSRESKKLVVSDWFKDVGVRNSAEMTEEQRKQRARIAALSRHAQTRWKDPKEIHREFANIRRQVGNERYYTALKRLNINPDEFVEVSWTALAGVNDLRKLLGLPKK